MKTTFLVITVALLAAVCPVYSENFYNWTEEAVVDDFKFVEFAKQRQWYEYMWWAKEPEPNAMENLFFYLTETSPTEAAVTLVGTKPSDPDKCVQLSGSGYMNFSLPDPTQPAKMMYYISPKYDVSRFNVIDGGVIDGINWYLTIQCITVEADGRCSKGLKVNFLTRKQTVAADTERKIETIINSKNLTVQAKDFTITKQTKECKAPVSGAPVMGLSAFLITMVFTLTAQIV